MDGDLWVLSVYGCYMVIMMILLKNSKKDVTKKVTKYLLKWNCFLLLFFITIMRCCFNSKNQK